jgi:hypothetical protein
MNEQDKSVLDADSFKSNLLEIQKTLNAPKGQFNAFGKYKYRSCEDILEALKPLLKFPVVISDEIVMIGDRYYVKATACYGSSWVTAYAREASDKKGMDEAQVTGSASSYARKYALNGLFAIDDTRDADTQDNTKVVPTTTQPPKQPAQPSGSVKEQAEQIKSDSEKVCPKCGAPMVYSKAGKLYCSKLCWKNPVPKQTQENLNQGA